MKKRILMISGAVYLPGEGGYKREMFLFDLMKKMGYDVTLITADFNHYAKRQRDIELFYRMHPDYKNIVFVHITPYKRNLSLKRLLAEKKWAREVVSWIEKHIEEFDLIYGEMPDIDVNIKVGKICDKYRKKFVLDIRDLRPEAYRLLIKNDLLYSIVAFFVGRKADKAYSCADELVAVSKEYLDRGLRCNSKSQNPLVVYLGATLSKFYSGVEKYSESIFKEPGEFWAIYAGTLGASYDLKTVLLAAKSLEDRGYSRIKFLFLGQGPEKESLVRFVQKEGINNVYFLGFKPYGEMAAYLCKSDVTLNAVKSNAPQSIINKVADYFASGVPMLNSCCCEEQKQMVDNYRVGFNYEPGNYNDLANKVLFLYMNPSISAELGANAKKLAFEKFDREKTHIEIVKLIDSL